MDDVALYNCAKILPTAPGSVMARSHLGGATVTWAAAGTNGGAPIAQYAVFADDLADAGAPVYKLVPASARSTSFEGLNGEHSYIFGVRALTTLGDSSLTAEHALAGTNLNQAFAEPALSIGKATTVSGRLTDLAGTGLAGQTVTLLRRRADKITYPRAATATTAADGSYTFAVAPRMARQTTAQTLGVRSKVSEFLCNRSTKRGHTVTFSGSVRPHHYAGQRVYLKRYNHGDWQVIKKVRLRSTNSYTLRWTPRARKDFLYRVYKPAPRSRGHRGAEPLECAAGALG